MSNLSSLTNSPLEESPRTFWWIDKKLLSLPDFGFESLTMTAPLVGKLTAATAEVVKNLQDKTDFVFGKTKDIFGFRIRLEQLYRQVQNTKVTWASLENLQVLGFDFISCQNRLNNLKQLSIHIGTSIQRTPISIEGETPNLSDDDVVASFNDLQMSVTVNKVNFFKDTTKAKVLNATEELIGFDKSMEAMCGYTQTIAADLKTLDHPIKDLAKHETVEVNAVHAVVDEINNRITSVNHLLNAMFLLQAYNKVMNVIFTDAVANLKE